MLKIREFLFSTTLAICVGAPLATIAATATPAATAIPTITSTNIDKIVIFGDSLSDNGNIASVGEGSKILKPILDKFGLTTLPPWPYKYDRFSNGEVWAENMAYGYFDIKNPHALNAAAISSPVAVESHGEKRTVSNQDDFIDYAYGGAWAETWSQDPGQSHKKWHGFPDDLNTQVNHYIRDYIQPGANQAPDSSLYFIWAGANDYLHGSRGGSTANRTPDNLAVINTMKYIKQAAENLIKPINQGGAGAKNIVFVNLPDLSQTPWGFNDPKALSDEMRYLSIEHNRQLALLTKSLKKEHPELKINLIDTTKVFHQIRSNPSQYGFTEINKPCVALPTSTANLKNFDPLLYAVHLHENVALHCQNPYNHMYFDHVHPSEHTHRLLAQYMCTQLKNLNYYHFESNKDANSSTGYYAPLSCEALPKASYDTVS